VSETDLLVLRPAAGPRRQVLTIAAVIAVVLIVAGVLAGGRPALITSISLVLLLAATIAVYLWRSHIVVTPGEISARGLTFHRRRDRALATSVIRATLVQPGAVSETIIVLDAGGPDGPVTTAQLARERPGTVGWIGRHPVALTLLCALGFAVAAVVLGTVVAALTG
jgi:hypothetical protein